MNYTNWIKRYNNRVDITSRITHLTRGDTDEEAFDKLCKILSEQKLIAGRGYICGSKAVCCFQEAPLVSIAENLWFEEENGKSRYNGFGIRTNKMDLYHIGGRPVFYGKTDELKDLLSPNEYWRIVDFELPYGDTSEITDWTHEREWRVQGDFEFEYNRIEIVLKNHDYYKRFIQWCISGDHIDILENINGIVTLDSIIC